MLIAFDMDGTLLFSGDSHKVKEVEKLSDTLARVKFPSLEPNVLAFSFENNGQMTYMALSTHASLEKLNHCKDTNIVIASGARPNTMLKRYFAFTAARYFILENGGGIYEAKNFTPDLQWQDLLQSQIDYLPLMAEELQAKGWKLDNNGRKAAIRVRLEDNPQKSPEEFKDLAVNLQLPTELAKTSNLGHLDIICADAGKDKALAYLSQKLNEKLAFAVGDDINDLPMLEVAAKPFLIKGPYLEAIEYAESRGWHVSKKEDVAGINQILQQITKNLGG